ncbi:MAG TPA: hypothetical protein VEH54_08890 [Steroidobacteraceae bacterium]|nr:hypothetical protein [Steroidobacteraceae bacterium]
MEFFLIDSTLALATLVGYVVLLVLSRLNALGVASERIAWRPEARSARTREVRPRGGRKLATARPQPTDLPAPNPRQIIHLR